LANHQVVLLSSCVFESRQCKQSPNCHGDENNALISEQPKA
jgi:hypothetical protein